MLMGGNILASVMNALIPLRESLLGASSSISQAAGAMLFTAIWQGAIVAMALTICLRLANRVSAALRFAVWTAGFLAVVVLPFLPLFLRLAGGSTTHSTIRFVTNAPKPLLQMDIRWSIAITLLWAGASLYRALDLGIHTIRLRRLWKGAIPIKSEALVLAAQSRLNGRKSIQICTTNELDRPSVIGFFQPRILIPEWLFARLTPGELDQILLHETEHLRRGDDWTNLLQKLSLVLFPLNPVLLWIERQLCLAREMACDEAVIRVTRAPRAYAACLTGLAEHGMRRVAEALSLGAWERRPELVQRVQTILQRKQVLGPLAARGLLTALAFGLTVGSVELARCPQLIAFTAANPQQNAQLRKARSLRPIGLEVKNASLDASRHSIHALPALATPSSKSHLTQLKATLPGRDLNPLNSQKAVLIASTSKLSSQPSPGTLERTTPRQEMLQAQIPDSSSLVPQAQQEQSWVVLTTWEEVDFTDPNVGQHASASDSPSSKLANRVGNPTSHMTVTQLIFRVLPANSASPTSTATPIRSGWLVIQL